MGRAVSIWYFRTHFFDKGLHSRVCIPIITAAPSYDWETTYLKSIPKSDILWKMYWKGALALSCDAKV